MQNDIRELYESGQLKKLVQLGLVPEHKFHWVQIYVHYEQELKYTKSRMQAMENVAINFDVSVGFIRKIRRELT